MRLNYRNAISKDEEELFDLSAKLSTSFKLNKTDFKRTFLNVLSNKDADLLVAEIETGIIAYVLAFHHSTFYANGLISWVEELFVLEDYRGKSVGKNLMVLIEEKAVQRGSKLVALATRRASDFYKAIGYDESAVYFKKSLSKAD
ncbi:GNAT family N-acetyltransferase [Paenibacillus nasutitermitis]|uniref:N-acetyltransferase n=1 Tax=Paenibacillus nasutitermitis TaxID=1652958 RepID=A0A916YW85_9BACL|nr:GNAT family N-acetyltransferase [Paenibacillus nasutitermitis]GGD62540.1 N-acetyltransferase [Paenibacillus nasutitermitis]